MPLARCLISIMVTVGISWMFAVFCTRRTFCNR